MSAVRDALKNASKKRVSVPKGITSCKRIQYRVILFFFRMRLLIVYFQPLLGKEHDFAFMANARHGITWDGFDKTQLIEFPFTWN